MLFTPSTDRRFRYRDPASLRVQRNQAKNGLPHYTSRASVALWLECARLHRAYVRNRVRYHDSLRSAQACVLGVRPVLRYLNTAKPLPR